MPYSSLPSALADALRARGYAEPTPVQAAVIAPEAVGRDLVVSAQTGSGKTVAFGLALGDALLAETGNVPLVERPLALIVAPTRELALQVSRELQWLYARVGLRIATCSSRPRPARARPSPSASPSPMSCSRVTPSPLPACQWRW